MWSSQRSCDWEYRKRWQRIRLFNYLPIGERGRGRIWVEGPKNWGRKCEGGRGGNRTKSWREVVILRQKVQFLNYSVLSGFADILVSTPEIRRRRYHLATAVLGRLKRVIPWENPPYDVLSCGSKGIRLSARHRATRVFDDHPLPRISSRVPTLTPPQPSQF